MQYLLTLRFRADSLGDYDARVALESEVTEHLGDSAYINGREVRSGETDIFIVTPDPAATFQRLRPVLQRARQLHSVTAMHRDIHGERDTVIWPRWRNLFERFGAVTSALEFLLYFVAGCAGAWFLGAYAGWGAFGYIAGFVLGVLVFIAVTSM